MSTSHRSHPELARSANALLGLRPYGMALMLFTSVSSVMYFADAIFLKYTFPWALLSLLMVAAVATLWGTRPAALILTLSAIFGTIVVPDFHFSYFDGRDASLHLRLLRMVLFLSCGSATIWLTHKTRLMRKRDERRREVLSALQTMILPETIAPAPGYDLSGVYQPARREEEVGGDFYDFFPVGNGMYGLLIGDVMGKGKEAAVSTSLLRYSLRALASMDLPPAQALGRLNAMIERQTIPFATATLFFGLLDASSGTFRYASAGHEPPFLRRVNGKEETLDPTGPLLGLGLDAEYEEGVIRIEPNDQLLLMTDGVTEARDDHGQFLESEGVWRLLRSVSPGTSSAAVLDTMTSALTEYIGHNSRDDIAMLLLRRVPVISGIPVHQSLPENQVAVSNRT